MVIGALAAANEVSKCRRWLARRRPRSWRWSSSVWGDRGQLRFPNNDSLKKRPNIRPAHGFCGDRGERARRPKRRAPVVAPLTHCHRRPARPIGTGRNGTCDADDDEGTR